MIPMSELFPNMPEPQETWEQKARVYIRNNPEIIQKMANEALYFKRHGVKRGMKYIADNYRYAPIKSAKSTNDDDEKYTWNNNYTTYVGDYLMEHYAELSGYFPTRRRSPKTRKVLA